MPLTKVALLARYGPRLGPWVGLADLEDALAYSLRELGITPASNAVVADSDLANVQPADVNQLDDCVMARALETILDNMTDDLLREAGINEKASDWRSLFERRVAKQQALIKDKYGVGLPVPTMGTVSLDFQSRRHDHLRGC